MNSSLNLKIADVIIQMKSRFILEELSIEERRLKLCERFKNFFYKGNKKADIVIDVEVVDDLPKITNAKPIFTTYHFFDGSENWDLLKCGKEYIYRCPLKNKKQLMRVNNTFDKVHAYLLTKEDKGKVWNIGDIIYDFLQVLLIQYFAKRKSGVFTHSIGVKDINGEGYVFAGKSGCGKSATARIWHNHTKAQVLNDDRIIVRPRNGAFLIYGSPWHGDFSDYLFSRMDSAVLKKLFFIHHASKNTLSKVAQKERFPLFYTVLFPTFWDKECLENIVTFSQEVIKKTPCYSLGFVKEKTVVEVARKA